MSRGSQSAPAPRSIRWVTVSVVSAVVTLVAIGALVLWALDRQGPSAGTGLARVRAPVSSTPSTTSTDGTSPVTDSQGSAPPPQARDASLGSLAASAEPPPTRLL